MLRARTSMVGPVNVGGISKLPDGLIGQNPCLASVWKVRRGSCYRPRRTTSFATLGGAVSRG